MMNMIPLTTKLHGVLPVEALVKSGVVYRIEKSHAAEVKAYLDHREINGYSIHHVPVYSSVEASKPVVAKAVVYIGTHDNPAFVGPMESVEALAKHIYRSRGPSGENKEYSLSRYIR
jgi:glutathione-specific gamma-glutamylcyclotransferase